ncbi:MAG: hypothetical protein BMS9Abin15_0771 [Gammaproteobacteria bacterium]|nr:MAG: hypothetical protein BMS9Abin15_0771 [Gammaproteobacteria bacterium]
MGRFGLLFLCGLMFSTAFAQPLVTFDNVEYEARFKALTEELRCLVCQNQSVAESNADLAKDIRNQVADMIRQGDSDEAVIDYLVARYGDFVLYRPPLKKQTLILWFGPGLLLVFGLVITVVLIKRRNRAPSISVPPSAMDRVETLLGGEENDQGIES